MTSLNQAEGSASTATPDTAPGFFRRLWDGWTRFAKRLGRAITVVWMVVVYFLVIPFFQLRRLADPLQKRLLPDQPSYWLDRPHHEAAADIQRLSKPF